MARNSLQRVYTCLRIPLLLRISIHIPCRGLFGNICSPVKMASLWAPFFQFKKVKRRRAESCLLQSVSCGSHCSPMFRWEAQCIWHPNGGTAVVAQRILICGALASSCTSCWHWPQLSFWFHSFPSSWPELQRLWAEFSSCFFSCVSLTKSSSKAKAIWSAECFGLRILKADTTLRRRYLIFCSKFAELGLVPWDMSMSWGRDFVCFKSTCHCMILCPLVSRSCLAFDTWLVLLCSRPSFFKWIPQDMLIIDYSVTQGLVLGAQDHYGRTCCSGRCWPAAFQVGLGTAEQTWAPEVAVHSAILFKAAWDNKNLRTREEAQRCASSWVERVRRCRENLADPKPQAGVFCSSPLLASTGFLVQLRGLPKIASTVANRCYFSSKNTVRQKKVPVCNGPVLEDRR